MDEYLVRLVELLEKIYNQEASHDESEFIWKQFHAMEQRYHTWMNYYSLFNGALLVAYCTLIVSTGEVIKTQCCKNTTYTLECSYWDLLSLIALLGIVASYCWLLSMIGHNHWLDNWRRKLDMHYHDIMSDVSGDSKLESQLKSTSTGKKVLPGFYSTYEVTRVFIWSIIIAWCIVFVYSVSKQYACNLTTDCNIMIGAIMIGAIIALLLKLLLCRNSPLQSLGSNLNEFHINKYKRNNQ